MWFTFVASIFVWDYMLPWRLGAQGENWGGKELNRAEGEKAEENTDGQQQPAERSRAGLRGLGPPHLTATSWETL